MSKTKSQKTGQIGENIACEYLEENSFQILEKNHKKPWGEIDIIAKGPDKALVFVEVKTMKKYGGGLTPESQMTREKIKKFKRAAALYAGNNQNLIDDGVGWRLDLVAITLGYNFDEDEGDYDLRHYTNIN